MALCVLMLDDPAFAQAVPAIPAEAAPPVAPPPPDGNPAAAIDPEAANTVAFPRAFFDEFRPQTASDMINRIPGFTLNGGDANVRGLAGSSGNVLIDGQRPVTKSLSLADVIRRIPASSVVRIDLIRGGAPGIDMQGQTLVANIIRDPNGYATVTAEFLTKLYKDRLPASGPRIEGSWTRGSWSASGAAGWRDERNQDNAGAGRIIRNVLVGTGGGQGGFEADINRQEGTANGTLEYRSGPDLARLNLSGGREFVRRRERVALIRTDGTVSRELVAADELEWTGEASADYEHVFSSTVVGRAMLLTRREKERNESSSFGRGTPQEGLDRSLEGETIGRIATTIVPSPSLTIDVSAEASDNFLRARAAVVRDGVSLDIPSANIKVTERRGNYTAFARWQATAWGSLELGTGYEASKIGQSGDAALTKRLRFWKPRAIATIDPADDWQVRLRAERLVGQLNFTDFAANVSLEPGATNAGNPDLVPETSWIVEGAVERRFWGRGAFTVTANRSWIRDAVDLVPIGNQFDAPGNIGSGWRRELRVALTLPLERLGVAGGQIRLNGTWRRSRVTDPTTGLRRRISDERPVTGDLSITKDLSKLKSIVGLDLFTGWRERGYRLFEIRNERSDMAPLSRLYWDYVPNARTALRVQLENFTARSRRRERILFAGPRNLGRIASIERREAILDPFIMIRLRQRL